MIFLGRKPLPLGPRGEALAAKALKRAGYKILERNAKLGRYEVDLIARDGDTIAFVEVKTRRTGDLVSPEENVHHVKRRRIISAAKVYIAQQTDPTLYYRFDVVSVIVPYKGKPDITILRDAFQA